MPSITFNHAVALGGAVIMVMGAFVAGVGLVAPRQPVAVAESAPFVHVVLKEDALEAKAAVLYDATTGLVLYQKNASAQLPLASLTKLMTAYTVLAQGMSEARVFITARDVRTEGNSGLHSGESVAIKDLVALGLVSSSNDAMAAAAASLGDSYVQKINEAAASLGLTKTHFFNPTGLDVSEYTSGAYGSAYDIARLAAMFLKEYPDFFEETTQATIAVQAGKAQVVGEATAAPLFDMPGFIGAKTGYTDLAGGNLVAAFDLDLGHPVVAAVLGSTREGRFEDIRTIIEAAREQLP